MNVFLPLTAGAAMTLGVVLLLARVLSVFGAVGAVELAILSVPALIAGVWTGQYVANKCAQTASQRG
jgi:hypothetical protein